MTEAELIKDIKKHSLAIVKNLKSNIVYKVSEITIQYSETIDFVISLHLDGISVGVYVDKEGSNPCISKWWLEYRNGKWIDD